ncbi:MAG: F0F1 ATP synthase subunit A [Lautropia sp.]
MNDFDPDALVVLQTPWFALNATIAFTWIVMAVLAVGSMLVTRRLSTDATMSPMQNLLEVLVSGIEAQVLAVSRQAPGRYLPFVGTLFLFVAASNLLAVVPGWRAPTASLSTTTALALCVAFAVPLFTIAQRGLRAWLRGYLQPSALMLPFNLIGEVSRTLALAVRLYGNMMSGAVMAGILLALTPFLFPVVMQLFGLLTGMVQAYIFAVLAMVYIASAAASTRGSSNG